MGLSAPRKRVKLSHDPNNTRWTRDTGGFGHKILTSQGWQPGEILGAKNASHAEFHTAANTSHIRVVVKDDNLGLGAKKGKGLADGKCTGLDVFQSLLGRLNGKCEDELAKEQRLREDLKRSIYTERRWGSIRFVQGGYLIGDKIQELAEKEEDGLQKAVQETSGTPVDSVGRRDSNQSSRSKALKILQTKPKKKKKRKELTAQDDLVITPSKTPEPMFKGIQSSLSHLPFKTNELLPSQRHKSGKKRKIYADIAEALSLPGDTVKGNSQKREKGKAVIESTCTESTAPESHASSPQPISSNSISNSGLNTPAAILGGRHAVRSRNIAQKRLAVLDNVSLNQIFMIK